MSCNRPIPRVRIAMRLLPALVLFICGAAGASDKTPPPPNARASTYGDSWSCDHGFQRQGAGCVAIALPANAFVTASGTRWECRRGFRQINETCVQTIVPVMLTHVANGKLSLERFIELTSAGPQRVFGIANKGRIARGYDADFTVVDLNARKTITNEWSASRCGWTPYDGMDAKGWPVATFIRGAMVMCDGALVAPGRGEPVKFIETLAHA